MIILFDKFRAKCTTKLLSCCTFMQMPNRAQYSPTAAFSFLLHEQSLGVSHKNAWLVFTYQSCFQVLEVTQKSEQTVADLEARIVSLEQ